MKAKVIEKHLAFHRPAGTSRGVYTQRTVWYVVLSEPDALRVRRGIGECAPLPDLSCDAVPDYADRLRAFAKQVAETGSLPSDETLRPYPSMRFGLETALRSFQASACGSWLHLFDTPFTRGEAPIAINGLVWMGTLPEMMERAARKRDAGFRCIKVKIGAIDFEEELGLIRSLRATAPEVQLRLDANGGFSPDEAPERLARLAPLNIHSIEQPIRAGQWETMAQLCRTSPIPIALDEELIGVNAPHEKACMLDTLRPRFLVLKPSLHGGMAGCEEWIALARQRGIGYWITSALETNIGLNAIAQWQSTLPPSPALPYGETEAKAIPAELFQGLGTGQLFVRNYPLTTLSLEGDRLWNKPKVARDFDQEVRTFEQAWRSDSPTMTVHTSGSTGVPKLIQVEKERMRASAQATLQFFRLIHPTSDCSALLCMPLAYIAGQMVCVRAWEGGLCLLAVAPSLHPFATLGFAPTFVALTPAQAAASLTVAREAALMRRVRCLLLGGGAVPPQLEESLRSFPGEVWSSYGMTETLSHIALRRLSGKTASQSYTPLPGVTVRILPDGCLAINAPRVCPSEVLTNDRAELLPDGSFRIIGRKDNVVCSGGLKLQIETLEEQLAPLRAQCGADYALTAVLDPVFGEALTLLYVAEAQPRDVAMLAAALLPRYERPRHVFHVSAIPRTETGKPAREALRGLAKQCLMKQGQAPYNPSLSDTGGNSSSLS